MSRWRTAFSSLMKTIYSLGSKPEKRLSECLPAADLPVYDAQGELKSYNGWHVFGSDTVRNHFIKCALILLSENGSHDMTNLTFDNFFGRSYDEEGNIWYTASIVAIDDFNVRSAIISPHAATEKASAFRMLMLHVETELGELLRESQAGLRSSQILPQPEVQKQRHSVMENTENSGYSSQSGDASLQFPPLFVNPAANASARALQRSFSSRY